MVENNTIENIINLSSQELHDQSGRFTAYIQEIGCEDRVSQRVVVEHICAALGGEVLYYQTSFSSRFGEPDQVVGCSYCNEQRGLHKAAGVVSIAMM